MNTANYEEDWLEQGRSMKKKTGECKNLATGFVWIFFAIILILTILIQ